MSNTNTTNTEATPVKAGRTQASWEKLGVKFKQTESIGFSLSGGFSEPHLTWVAVCKGQYVASGGRALEPLIEWMNKKEDKIIAKIKSIK